MSSNKRSSKTKTSKKTVRSPRKRANNQIDPDFESHYSKRRRLDENANNKIQCLPINERHFYHMQSLNTYLIENNNAADDSEDEDEHKTLYQQIHQRELNEHRFLNEGEKQLMILWNTFIESQQCFGLKHMNAICQLFVDGHIRDIVKRELYRNWLLHLCELNGSGLLTPSEYMEVVQYTQLYMGFNGFKSILDAQNWTEPKKRGRKRSGSATKMYKVDGEPAPKKARYSNRSSDSTAHG